MVEQQAADPAEHGSEEEIRPFLLEHADDGFRMDLEDAEKLLVRVRRTVVRVFTHELVGHEHPVHLEIRPQVRDAVVLLEPVEERGIDRLGLVSVMDLRIEEQGPVCDVILRFQEVVALAHVHVTAEIVHAVPFT